MVASDLYALNLPAAGAKRGDWILRGQLYKNLWNSALFTYSLCKEERVENIPDGISLISLFIKSL